VHLGCLVILFRRERKKLLLVGERKKSWCFQRFTLPHWIKANVNKTFARLYGYFSSLQCSTPFFYLKKMTQSILVERIKNYYREKYLGKKKLFFLFQN
jgi:hypothetical protein